MQRKNRRPKKSTQAKNAGVNAKQQTAKFKQLQSEYNAYRANLAKERKLASRARDKEYKSILKSASKTGLYTPKSYELTKYRKSKARQIKKDYGDYLDVSKYFFLPTPKSDRKAIKTKADNLELATSKTGIFFPKEYYKNARIKKDRKRNEYYIERTGKTKRGINKGLNYTDISPLASVDELTNERSRLLREASRIKLKKGEYYAFEVIEKGHEGFSRSTYKTIEQLLAAVEQYHKNVAKQTHFMRHIRIVKTTPMTWKELHPPKDARKPRAKKRRTGKYDTSRSKG